jgi:hypothetical protein
MDNRRNRRAGDDDVHHSDDNGVANRGASDPGPTRIHVARDVHNIGRLETLGLRCAL